MRTSVYCIFLFAMSGIAACSSDDGNSHSETVDNKVSRVASVICGEDSMSFAYDAEGRITRCIDMGGTDTMYYSYDTKDGRIYTSYRWHHESDMDYTGYREYTDTLFLKNGIVDSCAGWFAYGQSPDCMAGQERAYSVKFAYDSEGQIVSETLYDLFPRGTLLEGVYEFAWKDGNIVKVTQHEGFMATTTKYVYTYTSLPNQQAFGFTYDISRSYLRHHAPLVSYGYFGRQNRNLPECQYIEDGEASCNAYTFDSEGCLVGYSSSWREQRWNYVVNWETVRKR